MKRIVGNVVFLLLATFAKPCIAQSECTALAQSLTAYSVQTSSESQKNLVELSQLCTEHYDSANQNQKAQIAGAYGLISGSASGSSDSIKTEQDEQCGGHFGSDWQANHSNYQSQDVSAKTAGIVLQCFESARFRLVGLNVTENVVSASYRFGGEGSTTINVAEVLPANIAKCDAGINGNAKKDLSGLQGVRVSSGTTLTVNCTRLQDSAAAADPHQKVFPGGLLSVAAGAENVAVPLPTYAIPSVSDTAAEAMRKDFDASVQSLSDQLNKLQATVAQNEDNRKHVFKGQAALPNCTYVTNYGSDPSTMPPAGHDKNVTKVAWCPVNMYVAGTVNYKGQAQDFGVVCCPQ